MKKCPKCGSKAVGFGVLKDGTAINICRACYHDWKMEVD